MSFLTGQEPQSSSSLEQLQPCRRFKISEIQIATRNFDHSLVIGRGGFGKVYKGTITNGETLLDVAFKRLEATSNQGAVEFLAEIQMLSKLRHCHLVSLIGYCNDGREMILVYQYMPHGTLERHLHKRGTPLSWVRRLKICIGVLVLFEVLCGKQPVDRSIGEEQWSLARWAQDSIKEGMLKHIIDTNTRGRISPKCLKEFARLADSCLQSHPKQRPTMDEVVVGLESVLALQEKNDNMLQPGGMAMFGRKVPKFILPSNREYSFGDRSLVSLDIYLCSVEGETRKLRQFDFDTINVATENFSTSFFRHANGRIFKGRLQNGQNIAILEWSGSFTDYECHMNEALALVKLEHKNLIELLGYCIAEVTVYFVYDFAPHTSLDDLINGFIAARRRSLGNSVEDHTDKMLLKKHKHPSLHKFEAQIWKLNQKKTQAIAS